MTGKEKLYLLLLRIEDARVITPSGQPLRLDPANDLNHNYRDIELAQLFTKLEKDEHVLKVLKVPSRTKEKDIVEDLDPYDHADDGCWHIELLPTFDNYFLKVQQEPEYQEFIGKKTPALQVQNGTPHPQPDQEIEKADIDKWLAKKDKWTLEKIWQVVSALNAEWQLRDEDAFDIPHDKFERARITNSKDLEVILKTLHKYTVIEVSRKIVNSVPIDPNKPQASLWTTIIDKLEIAEKADTQIRIFPQKFIYLRDTLKQIVSKQSPKKNEQDKKQYEESVEWPEDFRWEGKTFVFGEYGKIDFKSKDRRHIFKTLTDKKGDWATIREMKSEKDAGYVRSTIKQIEDRLPKKVKEHIIIISTRDDDSEEKPNVGAYKIKILP